ncbi:hypothetical protein ABFS82_07G092500 [Erythranthe guttata]|uniref:putative disease resistance protein RGA3 n=1 Tax=Erythranthe guttata TaxID=4155 RepID=UPI00064D8163|nr:PREDICTED: putative disease resistance protein RGA3 [Erythranthe guttata]|eukprot:XP_012833059.1 PREDICTED: putative disease resistance protein RGA3 [Erythranthe guttata]
MAAEAAVGAAVQVLLQNLITLSEEQISLVRDFKKDLKKLKDSLSMIQDLLDDAEKKQITEKSVKRWLKKLEGVAFDADNVLDELNYQNLSKKIQTQYKMKKTARIRCFILPQCVPDARRLKMARKIKDINQNLEEINLEATKYGLQKSIAGTHAPLTGSSAGLETDSFSIDPIFLGRENDVSAIVKTMTTLPNGQVLSILPIVGMGGLGKSTVARQVFDHEEIRAHFDKHLWVHVSEKFDAVILLNKIHTLLAETNVELGAKQALLEKIQKHLGGKKFLLVLDDVWNENQEIWDDFINPLRGISSGTGNGIIVTTRSEIVSSVVRTLPVHRLKNLPEAECWSIIRAKAFREDNNIPSQLETVGVSIAKRCQGLPLAAKVVGALLRDKNIDEWISIEKNWLSKSGSENNVSNILKLSYDHLSSPSLKKCFAYCSIFPKGYNLDKERLVELWMAEGFLGGNDDMEIVGNKFFSLLLQNSLLQAVKKGDYNNTTYYNMHDLVHDLASSVSNSKTNNVWDEAYQVRYITLQSTNVETGRILKEQARYLRTLYFHGNVPDIMLSDFKCLHALIIVRDGVESNDDQELPSSFGELIHLRCLDISGIRIKCLTDSIGELYHLQTFRASYVLEKMPNTTKHLTSLRHLHIPQIELPPEIGRLTSLRTLPYFVVGDEKGCGIGELGSLKNLQGELEIYNLEKVHSKEEAESANLSQKPDIVQLMLRWSTENREGENCDESVLEGLQPHPNLRILRIGGFSGKRFPSWFSNLSGLNNLTMIMIAGCKECEQVPTLGHLPNLKSILLRGLDNVQTIGSSFYGIDDNCSSTSSNRVSKTVFPALVRLELQGMPKLTEWLEAELPSAVENQELVVFPRLEYLEVHGCEQLMSVPSHFPCLTELNIIALDSELPFTSICGVKLNSLTELQIYSIDGLTCLPDWLLSNNQNLRKLAISYCNNLMHLVPRLEGAGVSLRDLFIYNCPKLRELPDDLHSLNALEKLNITGCPNLETIPYPHEMMESSLESLTLNGLTNLRNMEMVIGWYCSNKMPRLSTLILDVPMMNMITTNSSSLSEITVGSSSSGHDSSLRYLSIDSTRCDEYSNSFIDAILKASTKSLNILSLAGNNCDDQSSGYLPDQIQHLTALSKLFLHDLGNIQEFPEWFGNNNSFSSSLQLLHINNCKKLRHLPSKEAMLRLTKLSYLAIGRCPLLNLNKIREISDDDDSEWPKISHIPEVYVDGNQIPTHAQ